jgi:hypothetical protein
MAWTLEDILRTYGPDTINNGNENLKAASNAVRDQFFGKDTAFQDYAYQQALKESQSGDNPEWLNVQQGQYFDPRAHEVSSMTRSYLADAMPADQKAQYDQMMTAVKQAYPVQIADTQKPSGGIAGFMRNTVGRLGDMGPLGVLALPALAGGAGALGLLGGTAAGAGETLGVGAGYGGMDAMLASGYGASLPGVTGALSTTVPITSLADLAAAGGTEGLGTAGQIGGTGAMMTEGGGTLSQIGKTLSEGKAALDKFNTAMGGQKPAPSFQVGGGSPYAQPMPWMNLSGGQADLQKFMEQARFSNMLNNKPYGYGGL